MGAREFGQEVEERRLQLGWTRSKLAVAIGILPDGTALDATQVRRLIEGGRRLDSDVVDRIAKALGWDALKAAEMAGVWPPGLTADMLRKLDVFAGQQPALASAGAARIALKHQLAQSQGHVSPSLASYTTRRPELARAA